MRIYSDGSVSIGNINPATTTAKLAIAGRITVTDNVNGPNGSAASPAFCTSNNITTGVFFPNPSAIGFSANGTERARIHASGGVSIGNTTDPAVNNLSVTGTINSANTFGFKNRIINGDMRFDQRNGGASVTPNGGAVTLDRWQSLASPPSKYSVQQNAGSVTPPVGFVNYLGVTSLSAYTAASNDLLFQVQVIEGYNFESFSWGSANAQTVTLSFWVRSSLTGTFSGSLQNSAENRSYAFTYSIPSANTWTKISVTIPGDTTGTWVTGNGFGCRVNFNLGSGSNRLGTAGAWGATNLKGSTGSRSVVGTNGATWYVTGVQLEQGTQATSFDYRPIGTEFLLCQRYFQIMDLRRATGVTYTPNGDTRANFIYPVPPRSTPTLTQSGTMNVISFGSNGSVINVDLGAINLSSNLARSFSIGGIANFAAFSGAGETMSWGDNGGGAFTVFVDAELT
jgi:hypothetical protein